MRLSTWKIPFICCIALLALLIYRWHAFDYRQAIQVPETQPAAAVSNKVKGNSTTPLPSIMEFQAILDRPLFMTNRRPFTPELPPTKSNKPQVADKHSKPLPPLDYNLIAIIITPAQRTAIIETPKDAKPHHLDVGERIESWTIETIEPEHIELERNSELRQMVLMDKNATKTDIIRVIQDKSPASEDRSIGTTDP